MKTKTKLKKKVSKGRWAPGVSKDEAYRLGKRAGMRFTIDALAKEDMFDTLSLAWIVEEWLIKAHKEILK